MFFLFQVEIVRLCMSKCVSFHESLLCNVEHLEALEAPLNRWSRQKEEENKEQKDDVIFDVMPSSS